MSSPSPPVAVSDEALQRAEQYVEEEEGAANKLKGWLGAFVRLVAFAMATFHLYTAYAIVQAQVLRLVHVAFVLFLCFMVFPVARRFRHRVMWWDWLAGALAIAIVVSAQDLYVGSTVSWMVTTVIGGAVATEIVTQLILRKLYPDAYAVPLAPESPSGLAPPPREATATFARLAETIDTSRPAPAPPPMPPPRLPGVDRDPDEGWS